MPRTLTPSDSEKLTLNLGLVDLGRIDLLVQEGFFGSRSDFIRAAIRDKLAAEAGPVAAALSRHRMEMGLCVLTRADLEAAAEAGAPLTVRVVGLCRIEPDVTPEIARAGIAALTVLGALQAPPPVRAALADRLR